MIISITNNANEVSTHMIIPVHGNFICIICITFGHDRPSQSFLVLRIKSYSYFISNSTIIQAHSPDINYCSVVQITKMSPKV